MSARKPNSDQQQTSSIRQEVLLEKFNTFMERAFQNDPSSREYIKQWELFRNLLKTTPLDYEKIYGHISKLQAAAGSAGNAKQATSNKQPLNEIPSYNEVPKEHALSPSIDSPLMQMNRTSVKNRDKDFKITFTMSPEVVSPNSYLPRVNKGALLEKFQKLREKMDNNTERLIRITQKHDANHNSSIKSGDRTPLRRVVVYSKEQNQNELFKEIENKLNYIKESSYNNYRILN